MQDNQTLSFSWVKLFKALFYLLGDKKIPYFGYTFLLIILLFHSTIPPLIVGKIVDFFTTYSRGQSLQTFYTLVFTLALLQVVVSFSRLTVKRRLGDIQSITAYNTRVKGFDKLMDLSLAWHDKEITGNKFQRIQNGIGEFWVLTRLLNDEVYRTFATILGMIGIFLVLKPTYVLFVLGYSSVFIVLLQHYYNVTSKLQDEQNKAIEQASGAYVEGLGNILTIKSSGAQKKFGKAISNAEIIRRDYEFKIRRIGIQKWQLFQALNGIAMGIFMFFIGMDVVAKSITVGSVVIFFGYAQQLTGNASDILGIYDQLIKAKSGIARMMDIMWSGEIAVSGKQKFPKDWATITLTNVSFSYPKSDQSSRPSDIYNVSLKINKFQKIGIVGKTGSGKSTIAKIMLGLYPLQSGSYLVDSYDATQISHEQLTKHIAIVLQESEMFNMSLKDNITLMRDIPNELVLKALKIAQLNNVIDNLPDGIETMIGEKGYHLSGGERQRVGIARAICKDPEIIIFDEATSSLDSQTERKIQSNLEKYLEKKTMIFIAHRISTLHKTDMIYVFRNGSIAERGTYKKLVNDTKSLFSTLYSSQHRNQS